MSEDLLKKAGELINKGKIKDALPIIENAMAINPFHPYTWHLKSRVLSALGNESEALDCLIVARKYGIDTLFTLIEVKNVPRMPQKINEKLIKPISIFPDAET